MSQSSSTSSSRPRWLTAVACVAAVLGVGAIAAGLLGTGTHRPRQALALPGGPLSSLDRLEGDSDAEREAQGATPARPGERTSRPGGWRPRRSGDAADSLANRGLGLPEGPGEDREGEAVDGPTPGSLAVGPLHANQPRGATRLVGAKEAALIPGAVKAGSAPGSTNASDSTSSGARTAEPFCGDNVVQGSEICEPPGTPLCSDDCVPVTDLTCFDCEQKGDCWEFSESCLADGFSPDQQTLCFDVQECVKDTDCADGAKPLAACFCGDLSTAACTSAPIAGPQSPAGACADVIRDAMGGPSVTNGQVLARLINIAYAGGAALARMNCQKLAPVCTAACGF